MRDTPFFAPPPVAAIGKKHRKGKRCRFPMCFVGGRLSECSKAKRGIDAASECKVMLACTLPSCKEKARRAISNKTHTFSKKSFPIF